MDLIYFLTISITSNVIFTIIFSLLNKSIPGLFVPCKILVNKTNKKTFIRVLFVCISLVICVFIARCFNFKNKGLGIILGGFMAMETIIFDKSIIAKQIGAPYTAIDIIDDEEFKSLLLEGKNIKAIKKYRVLTGLGLQKAIDYVNSVGEQILK